MVILLDLLHKSKSYNVILKPERTEGCSGQEESLEMFRLAQHDSLSTIAAKSIKQREMRTARGEVIFNHYEGTVILDSQEFAIPTTIRSHPRSQETFCGS